MAFVMISICRKDGDDNGDNNDDDGDDGKNNFSHEDVSHIYTTEAAISKLSYHSYISFFTMIICLILRLPLHINRISLLDKNKEKLIFIYIIDSKM